MPHTVALLTASTPVGSPPPRWRSHRGSYGRCLPRPSSLLLRYPSPIATAPVWILPGSWKTLPRFPQAPLAGAARRPQPPHHYCCEFSLKHESCRIMPPSTSELAPHYQHFVAAPRQAFEIPRNDRSPSPETTLRLRRNTQEILLDGDKVVIRHSISVPT